MKNLLSISTALLLLLGAICGSPKNALKPTEEMTITQPQANPSASARTEIMPKTQVAKTKRVVFLTKNI